ncbi:MAG: DNA polymerase III subunit beta [Planctomycetota bacterium]|nr:DNA polymerase III subunit beta [Planctomycetota bacterium]
MTTTTDGLHLICNRPALVEALAMVSAVVPSRSPAPVHMCVKLEASNGTLTLKATDAEIGLDLHLPSVEIKSEGEALLPAEKFSQIVRAMDDATVKLELHRHAATLQGAHSTFKIFGHDPAEFPGTADTTTAVPDFQINAGQLRRMIVRSSFAVATDNTRYAIVGVLFERKGRRLRLVATDGRRMAMVKGDCASPADGDAHFIVPAKTMGVLNRLLDDPETTVRVSRDGNRVVFEVGDSATLVTSLVDGNFPPFEEVIPKDLDRRATFDSSELAGAIKRAALLTNEESRSIKFSFESTTLTLQSHAADMGEAEIIVHASAFEGEPMVVGFMPAFLLDVLRIVESTEITLEMKSSKSPCLIKVGADFLYVLMPTALGS